VVIKNWAKHIHPAPFLKKKHKPPQNHLKTKPDSRITKESQGAGCKGLPAFAILATSSNNRRGGRERARVTKLKKAPRNLVVQRANPSPSSATHSQNFHRTSLPATTTPEASRALPLPLPPRPPLPRSPPPAAARLHREGGGGAWRRGRRRRGRRG
jgi:hypothetical protein